MKTDKDARRLEAARGLAAELAGKLDLNASLKLWDGSRTPLGSNVTGPFEIAIAGPGVIGSLLRRPTLDNFIRHYVKKGIDFSGGTLIDLGSELNRAERSVKLKGREALALAARLAPFLLARGGRSRTTRALPATSSARSASARTTRTTSSSTTTSPTISTRSSSIRRWSTPAPTSPTGATTSRRAQADKLEMICRKLRLKAGERFLDIGCGWGGLVCHAAKNYGVTAHGITLSENQLDYARAKVKRLGLEDRVTIELRIIRA